MSRDELSGGRPPRVFLADGALGEDACDAVRLAMDAGALETAEILGDEIELDDGVRRAAHVDVSDAALGLIERCLDAHRAAIERFFGCPLSGREGPGVLRYEAGGFYLPHVDRGDVPAWPDASRRTLTVVLFLNSSREADPDGDFEGGLLRLLQPGSAPFDLVPVRGRLVAFAADVPHEVTPVAGGRRDTVVDWYREA
jgi:predicted 2-oxoglutarate/Fe(II)-dependent dioxygenase YbiX